MVRMDMTEKDFSLRLAQLREEKGVSANNSLFFASDCSGMFFRA